MAGSKDVRLAVPEDAKTITKMLACMAEEMGDGAAFASTPKTPTKSSPPSDVGTKR